MRAAPKGTFDDADASAEPSATIAAALVAALDVRRFGDVLPRLLDHAARSSDLSDYDAGRYWHLRALVAWRVDGSVSAATHAFVRAERYLRVAGDRGRRYAARVHDTWGQMLHAAGLLADAKLELTAALAARDPSDEAGLAITLGNLGRLLVDFGECGAARDYLERDLAMVERISPQATRIRSQLATQIAHCARETGDLAAARAFAGRGLALALEHGDVVGAQFARIQLGRVALSENDLARAREAASVVTETLAEHAPSPYVEELRASAERLEADIAMREGRPDLAGALYRRAYDRIAPLTTSSPLERAEMLVGLARALARTGEGASSARRFREALTTLDATAAEQRRSEVEHELKSQSLDAWLVHAAGRFIGQHHIERLLDEAGNEGFRGARREVAALFSDIRGFTSLSERLDPETLIVTLNELLTQLTRAIERHGGSVDKFIGDAVMALFPAERNLDSAILAALSMRDEVERFNRRLERPLAMGIGIHAGAVVAGLIGSAQKREYTAIGDVVNTASRLEGLTKQLGASVLVSDAIVAKLADPARFLLRPLGTFAPKGRASALRLFDVMGERDELTAAARAEIDAATSALEAFSARDFVRAAERFEALAQAAAGTGREIGYELLAEAAREHEQRPPSLEWRGEIVMRTK